MPRVKLFNEDEALSKAMELFWKKGYNATSIQDLVNYVGINRASLYDTFGGKKKLFDSAFEHYRNSNLDNMRNYFLNPQGNVKKTLRAFFRMVIVGNCSDSDKKGCLVVNTTTELIPADGKLQTILNEHKENIENVFYEFLSTGVQTREISENVNLRTMSNLLYTLLNGFSVLCKTHSSQKESLASVDAVLSILD